MPIQAQYTAAANALIPVITKAADDHVPSFFRSEVTPQMIAEAAGSLAKVAVDAALAVKVPS